MKWLNKLINFNFFAAVIVVLTLLIRFLAIHMYDIHIDELIYADYAQSIASGYFPFNTIVGTFFLHPPGYYILLALWRTIFVHSHDIFTQLTVLRSFNIILSGFTVLIVILLTKLVTKKSNWAITAGALFALDPLAIRHNTRGLMETTAMLFLLAGLWLFLLNTNNPAANRKSWLLTGLLFGLAIMTKDVTAIFLFIALILMMFFKLAPDRNMFRYIIPTAILPYAIWIGFITLSGYLGQFISEKTLGLRRFFGLVQTTGFNTVHAPSKSDTLLSTLPHYASSYLIMGLGTLGILLVLRAKNKDIRRWGCIAVASVMAIGYLIVGGTFEEQFLYYLLIPSFITLVVALVELQQIVSNAYRYFFTSGSRLLLALVLLLGAGNYVLNISSPDNGWQKSIEWVRANVPPKSTICVFAQGDFFLRGSDYHVCSWHSLSEINAHHVQYIVDPEKLTESNYLPLTSKDVADIKPESRVVFSYTSRDSGRFLILEIPRFATSSSSTNSKVQN